jgi:hypothetical protein
MMTEEPEVLDNVAQLFKNAMEGQTMDCARPTTSAEWHGYAAVSMEQALFDKIVNGIKAKDLELAIDLVENVHRKMPEKFLKRFFFFARFVHSYCRFARPIEPWMYKKAPLHRLAIMMLSVDLILDDRVREKLVAAYVALSKEYQTFQRHEENQRYFQKRMIGMNKIVVPGIVFSCFLLCTIFFMLMFMCFTINSTSNTAQQTEPVPQPSQTVPELLLLLFEATLRALGLL